MHSVSSTQIVEEHSQKAPKHVSVLETPATLFQLYSDRICPPAETIAGMQKHLASLGITRIAQQTGLDRIGIPTYAAFRPNARSLSVNQGKGLDDDSAMASAIMEAAEFAIAEQPDLDVVEATRDALMNEGRAIFNAHRLMPMGQTVSNITQIEWVEGTNLFDENLVMVPYDAVLLDATSLSAHQITRTTNGLASGNTEQEAIFHGLCELIERDASSLFTLRTVEQREAACVNPADFNDRAIDDLCALIENAGLRLTLFDQTTDLDVPVTMAVIADKQHSDSRHFDVTSGYGCHPIPARAAIRAITEAAQSRITNIAGSRDDFDPAEYHKALSSELSEFTRRNIPYSAKPPKGFGSSTNIKNLLSYVRKRLQAQQIGDITIVRLGGTAFGISVVRILAPQLEDRVCNPNWRPGARATRQLMSKS